ncbi:MAG: thioredoxin-dependent thiol peroxidase [Victivallales bacterium]|nr:thioredoxin-dependent thiol peroxidase [Victivallales bacterium]
MFRDVVENANLLDQWYVFRDKKYGKLAMEWLDDNGIDFVDGKIIQLKEWKINHGEHIMNIGEYAPDFTLQDKDGKTVSLSDFKGRKVVVYFYPKDNTPGCSRQAVGFAENYNEFQKRNITVIGISKDSVESHVKFAEKYNLPFVLLSDPELTAIQAYGVWQEKKLYGKASMGVVRSTFIIDEKGIIVDIMRKVKPDTNAADILAKIE